MNTWIKHSIVLLAALSLGLTQCERGAPEDETFSEIEYLFADNPARPQIKADMIAQLGEARLTIDFATSGLKDEGIAGALIAAKQRGVDVRVVADSEAEMDAGVLLLEAAGVEVVYGDGEIKYLPDPTLTSLLGACFEQTRYRECSTGGGGEDAGLMVRPDNYNRMSNNFFVVDGTEVWSLGSPIDSTGTVWLGWKAHSQDLSIAFTREFQQMAGGVFASTLDVYNGPVKSTVHGIVYDSNLSDARPGRTRDLQPGYLTDKGILRIEFNPQQRLSKEIIDEIYKARGSVYLMTDELLNTFAINALLYKARAGFVVDVVLRSDTPIINQVQELIDLSAQNEKVSVRLAPTTYTYLPTLLITDEKRDRNGEQWARTALVLTHSLMNVAPFQIFTPRQLNDPNLSDDVVRIYPTDSYADGTLWTMREFLGDENRESNEISRAVSLWESITAKSTPAK